MSKKILIIPLLIIVSLLVTGCFTGIESTKKITLSREDKRQTAPTPEETYLADILPSPHSAWQVGKEFYVADSRASVMIDAFRIVSGKHGLERGDVLSFREARDVRTPDGTTRTTIVFGRGNDEFRYMARETAKDETVVMSDAIPGLIDLEMVKEVGEKLVGDNLWTMSQIWLDDSGERKDMLKYYPVTIDSVVPGTMVFPLKVYFNSADSSRGNYLLNFGNSGKDSRGFANMFSLTDPRLKHPGITDEVWEHIRRAEVAPGMTKMECRLAKGNPSDVYDGHDYSKSLLLWVYPDATTLYFEDDILVRVKGY